jgi:hypothetical protein
MASSWPEVTIRRSVRAAIIKSATTKGVSVRAMNLINNPDFRLMCEVAGARYLGTCNNVVLFQDPEDGFTMKLWCFACKSPDDVRLAIKAHRNQVHDFPAWEPVEKQEMR